MNFKLGIRMGRKVIYVLGFSSGTICSFYRELSRKEKIDSEWYFSGRKCPVVMLTKEESEAQFEVSNWFLEHYKDFTVL